MQKQKIKVLMFDLDDTLSHFDDYWTESLLETFRRHPVTGHLDPQHIFEKFWEQSLIFQTLYHEQKITIRDFRNYRLIEAMARFNISIDEATADDFNAWHKNISRDFMKASPALLELLIELKRSYSLGIVTNGTSSWQYDKLEALGIRTLFPDASIIISEDVGCDKPDPAIYVKALEEFQVWPEEVLFIGDSWRNDVEGPMRVGMQAIWYNPKQAAIPQGVQPYAVIGDIQELRELLLYEKVNDVTNP